MPPPPLAHVPPLAAAARKDLKHRLRSAMAKVRRSEMERKRHLRAAKKLTAARRKAEYAVADLEHAEAEVEVARAQAEADAAEEEVRRALAELGRFGGKAGAAAPGPEGAEEASADAEEMSIVTEVVDYLEGMVPVVQISPASSAANGEMETVAVAGAKNVLVSTSSSVSGSSASFGPEESMDDNAGVPETGSYTNSSLGSCSSS